MRASLTLKLKAFIFASIIALSVLLWLHLARGMPLRYFAWFCLLTGAIIAIQYVIAKSFGARVEQNRKLRILLESILGIIFVVAFYFFAVYVFPGTK